MHIFGFNILPLIIFLPSLFLLFFLFNLTKKAGFKKTLVISGVFTGFFGFFLSAPIPLNSDFFSTYFLLPIGFLCLFIFSSIGAIVHNINPFSPNAPLLLPKQKKQKEKIKRTITIFEQTPEESHHLTELLLKKCSENASIIKNNFIQNGVDDIHFPYTFINKKGVFTIFPCNWSGKLAFKNDTFVRFSKTNNDVLTTEVFDPFKEIVLKNALIEEGFNKIPVHKIILITNPSAFFEGANLNSDVSVIDLGNFNHFINNFNSDVSLSPSNIEELSILLQKK